MLLGRVSFFVVYCTVCFLVVLESTTFVHHFVFLSAISSTYPAILSTCPPFCLPFHHLFNLCSICLPIRHFVLHIRHFVYQSTILSIYPPFCLHFHHFIYLSAIFVYLPPFRISIRQFVYISTIFPTNLPICLYTFVPCLSTYPPFFSPVCHFVRISATFATFLLDLTVDTSNEDTLEITTLPRQHGIPDKDDIIF